jgi:hypothetical protein
MSPDVGSLGIYLRISSNPFETWFDLRIWIVGQRRFSSGCGGSPELLLCAMDSSGVACLGRNASIVSGFARTPSDTRSTSFIFSSALMSRCRVIMMIVPGADDIQLYQPTHKLAYNL